MKILHSTSSCTRARRKISNKLPQFLQFTKTEFSSSDWKELKDAFENLSSTDDIQSIIFLILDQQSTEDRKVVIIQKTKEIVTPDGTKVSPLPPFPDKITEMTVWTRYRAPFEDAWVVQCGIEGFCGLETAEKYFDEVIEREECLENTDSE